MTLESQYRLQARISALEALVLEMLAAHPRPSEVASALEASLSGQHALQIAGGIHAEFADAFRDAQKMLLDDVHLRIRGLP